MVEEHLWYSILRQHQWDRCVMIGDGVTDLETRDVVDAFIGYSGVKDRPNVQEKADWSVKSFFDLVNVFEPSSCAYRSLL